MLDDAGIAATIKAGLLDNKDTHAGKINVESYKGVVQLSGFVGSRGREGGRRQGREGRVTECARSTTASRCSRPTSFGTKLDDSLTTGRVKAALMDSADVKSMQINVETTNGVTQLAGFVTSAGDEGARRKSRGAASTASSASTTCCVVKPR